MTHSSTNKNKNSSEIVLESFDGNTDEVEILDKHLQVAITGCSMTSPHKENKTWATILQNLFGGKLIFRLDTDKNKNTDLSYLYHTAVVNAKVAGGNYFITKAMKETLITLKNKKWDYQPPGAKPKDGIDRLAIMQLSGLNRYDIKMDGVWVTSPSTTRYFTNVCS